MDQEIHLLKQNKTLQSCVHVFLHPPPKTEPLVMFLRLGCFSGLICRAAGIGEGCQGAEVGMSEGGRSALGRLCSQVFPNVGHRLRVQKQNLKCFGRQQIKQIREVSGAFCHKMSLRLDQRQKALYINLIASITVHTMS